MPSKRKGKRGPWRRGELPSRNVVRFAVETAALITRGDAEKVLSGYRAKSHSVEMSVIARTRTYAAFALRAIFESGREAEIARMCGANSPHQWLKQRDLAMKGGHCEKWWSDAAFMRVIEAVEAFIAQQKVIDAAEENCTGHVASAHDAKVCGKCGTHIDALRPM